MKDDEIRKILDSEAVFKFGAKFFLQPDFWIFEEVIFCLLTQIMSH